MFLKPVIAAAVICAAQAILPSASSGQGGASAPSRATYVLDFTGDILAPRVRAELRVPDGRIFMAGWGADMHKRGWAHYIQDLRVSELNGREARFADVADSAVWRLADPASRVIRLEYRVDLSYAREQWPYGNEQAATLQGQDLYSVSKALFIVSAATGETDVRFVLPRGWHAATPWMPAGNGTSTFSVRGSESLINNSVVVGPTAPATAHAGRFTFILAALGDARADRDRVASVLQRIVQEYVRIFPQTSPSRYLMTLFRAAERDAEAFGESAAFSEPDSLTEAGRILWASTLAHELFHAWNGHAIRPAVYTDMQWMSEGFTDYYASRSLASAGVIDEPLFVRKLEHALGLYLYFRSAPSFDGVTLVAAGARKSTNRLGVYNGGWVAAFCMDTQIRTASGGAKNLDDVMRLLYERFGLTGRTYTLADVRAAAADATGTSFDGFFDRYIAGNETIPVAECLTRAGYEGGGAGYDGDYFILRSVDSEYRNSLFGPGKSDNRTSNGGIMDSAAPPTAR